jgi:general stress protein 26
MSSEDVGKIVEIMRANSLHAYLATVEGDQPIVRPVSPIVEDDMSIWVTTYSGSRKVKQLNVNPKLCLAFVEQPNGDKAAIVLGEARIITDMDEKKRVWGLAKFDMSVHFPGGPESGDFCVLKVDVKRVEWRDSWKGGVNVYEPVQ